MCCVLVPMVTSLTLNCKYSSPGWGAKVGDPYACQLHNLDIVSPTEVATVVTGKHHGSRTHVNVRSLQIYSSPNMTYIPKGIEQFFHNIFYISIKETGLVAIRKNDLKPFPKLKWLFLSRNQLQTLNSGLFRHNPKLNMLGLEGNQLNSIAADIFDPIEDLQQADFRDNVCINSQATNREKVKEVEQDIIRNCQNFLKKFTFTAYKSFDNNKA